jgi:hypothetical protein
MKLFKLVPTANAPSNVRYYEAAIVAAATADEARRVHPATSDANKIAWDVQEGFWRSHWADGTTRRYINTSWPANVEDIEVTEIGETLPATKAGLLLARHCIN